MRRILFFIIFSLFFFSASAEDQAAPPSCAAQIFSDALAASMSAVSESDQEHVIRGWIYQNFQNPDVIKKVLECPEFANVADDDAVKVPTVMVTFPNGSRTVSINYETQPKLLKQRLMASTKRGLPADGISPRIDGNAIWTNTEPAWYGILVVESGTLNQYIGDNGNYTLSLRYLEQNIDKFEPKGNFCTSKSALANDDYLINRAAHKTVGIEDDTNDYYVAGDVNLQWITWAEVALDVAITVATVGTGGVVLGATKAARAAKSAKQLVGTIKTLEKSADVKSYITATRNAARASEELKTIDRATDAARYTAKSDEVAQFTKTAGDLEKIDDVRKYKTAATSFDDLMKLRRAIKGIRVAQRGNVIARTWRAARATMTGGRTLNKGARVARAGLQSGKIRDWLFHSTLRNIGRLAKMEMAGGFLYGAMTFVSGMYDWTETSVGDFTSGIEFKPLGLLSADDLSGQENVVNHGMWLMWAGDSISPTDDDAAYLQAMDFAAKFHQDLTETQDEAGIPACNVDIFVVRPIIRNPDAPDQELYYLIMNDTPWSTNTI